MSKYQFKENDLVWAKLRGYPFWPARIESRPPEESKHNQNFVFFYGTENYAWIPDKNIYPYEDYADTFSTKGKSSSFRKAVDVVSRYYADPDTKEPNEIIKNDCCAAKLPTSPIKFKEAKETIKNDPRPGPSRSLPGKLKGKRFKTDSRAGPSCSSSGKTKKGKNEAKKIKKIKNNKCRRPSRKLPVRLKLARNPAERRAQIQRFLRVKLLLLKKRLLARKRVKANSLKKSKKITDLKKTHKGPSTGRKPSCASQVSYKYRCDCFMTDSQILNMDELFIPKGYSLLNHSKEIRRKRHEAEALERKKMRESHLAKCKNCCGDHHIFCSKINTFKKIAAKEHNLQAHGSRKTIIKKTSHYGKKKPHKHANCSGEQIFSAKTGNYSIKSNMKECDSQAHESTQNGEKKPDKNANCSGEQIFWAKEQNDSTKSNVKECDSQAHGKKPDKNIHP